MSDEDPQRDMKRRAAAAALELLEPGAVIGVGTGSTTNHFIDLLAPIKDRFAGAVASSVASAQRLESHGIPLLEMAEIDRIPVYVDGADECTPQLKLIKGGGGALTREKVIAAASRRFVCIVDESKLVDKLGAFPLPVEVIPMARAFVAREIADDHGGRPVLREGFTTDNGNLILDVHDLEIDHPTALEMRLNHIAGVVTNGLFARRGADVLLLGTATGVRRIDDRI